MADPSSPYKSIGWDNNAQQWIVTYQDDTVGFLPSTESSGTTTSGLSPAGAPVTEGALNVTYGPGGGALLALPAEEAPADTQRQSSPQTTGGYSRDYSPRAPGGGYSDYDYGGGGGGLRSSGLTPSAGGFGGLGDPGAGEVPGGPAHVLYQRTPTPERTYHEPVGTLTSGGTYPGMPGPKWGGRSTRGGYGSSGGTLSQYGDGGGGGGGGGTSALYQKFAAKGQAMEDKVRGMAGAIQGKLEGGGSSSYGSSSSGSYSTDTSTPDIAEPKMRGFARGMDPEQAMGLAQEPSFLLPKLFPGLSGASPLYKELSGLPAAQLAMLTDRKSDQGPSDFTNALAGVYKGAALSNDLPDTGQLLRNLTNPGKGLEQTFTGTPIGQAPKGSTPSYEDPKFAYGMEPLTSAESAYQFAPLLDASLIGLPSWTAASMGSEGYGGYLMDRYGAANLNRKPSKTKYMGSYVGRRLLR